MVENQWFHYPSKRRSGRSERRKEKKKGGEKGDTRVAIGGRTRAVISPGSTAIMLCSADRTKNQGAGFGDRRTGRIMLDGERAESIVALPVSIGSISLSSCQLFLCARQIVAAEYIQKRTEEAGTGVGRGVVGLN